MNTSLLGPDFDPTALPHGTKVGSWRVHGIGGRGTFGTVYLALRVGHEQAGPAALKLAVYAGDPCFEREAELLSRIRHPSVPRLLDTGLWKDSAGPAHPFVVMEWVEGVTLYQWAARRNPSSRQMLAVLAQAAGALQATHEVSGVHRDVKGDNLLVRPADGRLFLTDFGSGYCTGVKRLTPVHVLPGTPAYRSPQMWDYVRPEDPNATSPTLARPSDDVFALGVMAHRLVTDTYPPFTNTHTEQGRCWLPGGGGVRPPRQLNPRVDPQLNALIMRMLSPKPGERGTGGELAEAMLRGVRHAGPSADAPLFEWETQQPSQWTEQEQAEAEQLGHRPRRRDRERARKSEQADAAARAEVKEREAEARARMTGLAKQVKTRNWLPWLAATMALGLWPENTGSVRTEEQPSAARSTSAAERDAVSLGDTALSSPAPFAKDTTKDVIALDLPKKPVPGQLKPAANGRCLKKQVAINGGCWAKVALDPEECHGSMNVYVYQGGCYMPITTSTREPTSAPNEK